MSTKKIILLILFIFILLGLNHYNIISTVMDKTIMNKINSENNKYLDNTSDKSIKLFTVLSTYKALVAIIEGSGVGIQIGDIVQSINDFIDITWKTVLLSIVSINIQKLLLNNMGPNLFKYLLMIGLIFLVISLIIKNKKINLSNFLNNFAKLFIILAIIVYILIPFIVYSSNKVSSKITTNKIDNSIEQINREINKINKIGWSKWRFDKTVQEAYHIGKDLFANTMNTMFWIMTCFILDCFIFPFIFIILSFIIGKIIINNFFSNKNISNKKLYILFEKYFKKETK